MSIRKNASHLSDKQLETIHNVLTSQKQRFLEDIRDEKNLEDIHIKSIRDRNRKEIIIKRIDHLLKKIKNGNYGICDECETSIPIERLNLYPLSNLCVVCKEDNENEKLYHSHLSYRRIMLTEEMKKFLYI